jgi:FMN phosphatase YigB (HAD superfamily)
MSLGEWFGKRIERTVSRFLESKVLPWEREGRAFVRTMDLKPPLFRSVAALEEYCMLLRPDIVSLDLFDTLMFREALSPECIFYRMLDYDLFKKSGLDRSWVEARQKACHQLSRLSPKGETTLSEIYNFLGRIGVFPPELTLQMMEIELLEELKSWRPNTEMLNLVYRLSNQDMSVVVNSDTYLPPDDLQRWIDRFLPGVPFYCSSATMRTKSSGRAFAYLKTKYPNAKILHIGDNLHSDGIMARRMEIDSAIIDGRGRFFSTLPEEVSRLARLRGLKCLPSWRDDELPIETSLVVAQWAYGWALFLICFLEAIARFVRAQRIEEVWFTSRDCETLFQCLTESGRIGEFSQATYIYTSGSSLAPLVASQQTGERPEERHLCEGYIRAQLSSAKVRSGKAIRLLLVDIGGRGTLQRAIETTLGDGARVTGYYVALHPTETWLSDSQTECFFDWNRAKFCEPMTELMFGFLADRCVGYRTDEYGTIVPKFQSAHGDTSDPIYTKLLRRYLTELLKENWRPELCTDEELTEACSSMVQRFHMFPTKTEALAVGNWSYKSRNGKARSIDGDGLSLAVILTMHGLNDNYWPHGALARRIPNRILTHLLQQLSVYLRHLKRTIPG